MKNQTPLAVLGILFIVALASCNSAMDKNISASRLKLNLKNAEIYLTAKGSDHRLSKLENSEFTELNQPDEHFPTIMVDPNKSFQTMLGFGGALTDAAAETFYKLSEQKQAEIISAYFDAENGIGYNLCRVPIHSCDFSSESYAYTEVPDDTLLAHFSIEKDRAFKLPLIKRAISATDKKLKLFASPWSPPAWMKTNNNMLQGGKLKPEYYQTWANYYVRFIDEYHKESIPIWGLTVQNEPMATQTWESCIYTAEEEKNFVKYYLGPTIKKSDYPDTRIIIWDHNRGLLYQRAQAVYCDPEASKYVWGTGFHWYTGDHFDNVKLHYEAFPDKGLLFTEGCGYPFNLDSIYVWHWGERYAESILHDLNNGTVGWVDWNILLDETGGPNHVSNFCLAPVIGNTQTDEVHYMISYYYMGHFSKFIHRGAKRVACSSNSDDLLATAFLNPDKTIAVVVLNQMGIDITYKTWIDGKNVETVSPAHSIMTLIIK